MKYTVETIEKNIHDVPDRCGLTKENGEAIIEYVQKHSHGHNATLKSKLTEILFYAILAAYSMGFQRGLKYQGRKRKGVNNG